jgi:hypothetical protein
MIIESCQTRTAGAALGAASKAAGSRQMAKIIKRRMTVTLPLFDPIRGSAVL